MKTQTAAGQASCLFHFSNPPFKQKLVFKQLETGATPVLRWLALLAMLATLNLQCSTARAQGTAFTYQGRLNNGGSPAGGTFNLQFTLFTTNTGGTAVAGPFTTNGVVITNGLFSVAIDLGAGVWNGQTNWLQIGVETNGAASFTTLTPRQELTPVPYAIYAGNATTLANGAAIGAGAGNIISSSGATDSFIGGGTANNIEFNSLNSFIGGGIGNTNLSNAGYSVIGGGEDNQTASGWSVISGGQNNVVGSGTECSTIGGGYNNTNSGRYATLGGGFQNVVSGYAATVGGGEYNTASADSAAVPGGIANLAAGVWSLAAGQSAQALYQSDFVWADSSSGSFASTGINQFLIRAEGGVGINLNNPTDAALSVGGRERLNDNTIFFRTGTDTNHGVGWYGIGKTFAGAQPDGPVLFGYGGGALGTEQFGTEHLAVTWDTTSVTVNGTFNNNSDRNAKQDFVPVTSSQILDQVAHLPVSEWSYKTDPATRHVGPMAQDFHSLFNVGTDDRHIAPMDEGGVALAAIQGLNQKLEEQNKQKDAEIADLKERLNKLEQLITSQKGDSK